MRESRPITIAKRYLRAIWGGDPKQADALMAPNVVFVDSCGERLVGFAACSQAARAFDTLEPHCRVTIVEAFERSGTIMLRVDLNAIDPRIAGPYLIAVKVADGKVCEWQTHRHDRVPYVRVLRRAIAAGPHASVSSIDNNSGRR